MQIEVISVSVNTVPTAKGSYQVAEVAYKDLKDGKVNGKKIMSFAAKDVFKAMSNAKQGDKYDVGLEKDDKGYWQWKTATAANAQNPASPTSGNPSPRSTYETPEERAKRQDFIIRQSSVASAIALLKTEKNIPEVGNILSVAEQFVQFVYGKMDSVTEVGSGFNDMSDDIPE